MISKQQHRIGPNWQQGQGHTYQIFVQIGNKGNDFQLLFDMSHTHTI
jgi:6-pyruvoyl-tetrahydropterin synthase